MSRSRRSRLSTRLVIFLFVCSTVLPRILATEGTKSEKETTENGAERITTKIPNEDETITASPEKEKYNAEGPKNTEEEFSPKESDEDESESGEQTNMILDIKGPCAAVFTPFDMNGEINIDVIPEYISHLNKTGIRTILVCGTPGEGPAMNTKERKRVLEEFMKEGAKCKFKVIVQIGGASIPDELELIKHAQEMKADAIMVQPQMYYKPKSIEAIVDYLELISKAGPELPIIFDAEPLFTGVYVNIRQLFRAASKRLPKFAGVVDKYSTLVKLVDLVRGDQKLFVGYHSFATNALMGFDNTITTVDNVFHDQAVAITEAVNDGDFKKAREMQNRLSGIILDIEALGKEVVPIFKATMEIVTGIKMGPVRPPEENLTESQRQAIRHVLESYGVEIKS